MVDAVEAFPDVGVEHILGFVLDVEEDGRDRIVAGAPWPEAVAVGLELGLPFGFQGELHEGLSCAVVQHGDTQGARLCRRVRLWYPHPPNWLRSFGQGQVRDKRAPLPWGK
jgi:hypothetical protein